MLAGSALVALLGVSVAGCNRSGPPQMPERPPAPVTAVAAEAKDVPVYIDEIGRAAPFELVNVLPQVAGKVTAIHFADGAELKKGDLLFTVDARPFEAALAEAEAAVAMNQADVELARQDLARVEELRQGNAATVSQQEFDTRRNALAVADAKLKAARAAVERAKLDVEYCTIRSPIDGRAGLRQVDVGNVVKENEANLLVVQRLDPIYADFVTAERNLPTVRGHMAGGTLKVLVQARGDKAPPREGDLTFLDTAVQQGAGTVKLRATLKNNDRHFWAGQFVDVRLVLEVKKDAVLVPSTAVQIGQQGPYVYVVKGDSTAELRPVTTGQRQGDSTVIEKGVAKGETVVTTGQMAVMPGAKVRVEQPVGPDGQKAEPKAEGMAGL